MKFYIHSQSCIFFKELNFYYLKSHKIWCLLKHLARSSIIFISALLHITRFLFKPFMFSDK